MQPRLAPKTCWIRPSPQLSKLFHRGMLADGFVTAVTSASEMGTALVLQLRFGSSFSVVASLGDGLVSAPPRGPGEYLLGEVQSRPDDLNQQSPNFRLSQRDHLADFFERPLLGGFAAARITLRKANAIIDSVMCRYQPSHERTSYSSSPVSCLPASKHTSMAQR